MSANLIVNPAAESGVTGWQSLEGAATVIPYGASGYPTPTGPGPQDRGSYFFTGGDEPRSRLAQTIVLPHQAEIDQGHARFAFEGWLGGYSTQDDGARLSLEFLSSAGQPLGVVVLGPVTASERGGVTGLWRRSAGGVIPPGSRSARALLLFTRAGGTANDGYADGLSLTVSIDRNLVSNPGAENGLSGWTVTEGAPTTIVYGSNGYPTFTGPGPADRGQRFFSGGTVARSRLRQEVALGYPSEIDAGHVRYDLSAWLGGWKHQDDSARVTAAFLNSASAQLAVVQLGPVLASDRGNVTGLFERTAIGMVPAGSRVARIEVLFVRSGGSSNDGYADQIALALTPGSN